MNRAEIILIFVFMIFGFVITKQFISIIFGLNKDYKKWKELDLGEKIILTSVSILAFTLLVLSILCLFGIIPF